MNYEQAYQNLVTEQNLSVLKLKMAALRMYNTPIIEAIEIKNNGEHPFLAKILFKIML